MLPAQDAAQKLSKLLGPFPCKFPELSLCDCLLFTFLPDPAAFLVLKYNFLLLCWLCFHGRRPLCHPHGGNLGEYGTNSSTIISSGFAVQPWLFSSSSKKLFCIFWLFLKIVVLSKQESLITAKTKLIFANS